MKTTACRLTVSTQNVCVGGLLATASAEIEVSGVVFKVHGFEVRRGLNGRLRIDGPGVIQGGSFKPAVELPPEIEREIGREIESLLR